MDYENCNVGQPSCLFNLRRIIEQNILCEIIILMREKNGKHGLHSYLYKMIVKKIYARGPLLVEFLFFKNLCLFFQYIISLCRYVDTIGLVFQRTVFHTKLRFLQSVLCTPKIIQFFTGP